MTKHAGPSEPWDMTITADSDPIAIFETWMADARAWTSIKDANAMVVSTVSDAGQPHARVVLCKDVGPAGFVFYTNYQSRKARELSANPRIAALFYWDPLFRQVKIDGVVETTSREQSVAYWRTRARGSQLSQYISHQSDPLTSHEALKRAWDAAEAEFEGRDVPCPPHWGGYRIVPRVIEFWIGGDSRLHDRHEFTKYSGGWTYRMLYP